MGCGASTGGSSTAGDSSQGSELIMEADAGDDIGQRAEEHLNRIKEGGVLLAACSPDYAEYTGAPHNSYSELKFAYDNKIPIWPLRVQNIYPPVPDSGRKDQDPRKEGPAMIALAIGPRSSSLKYLDCRQMSSEEIAKAIGERLEPLANLQS
eukprot:Skav222740  [mRNA]  locus=scaffold2390:482498:482953:+ [translate_table: standard]